MSCTRVMYNSNCSTNIACTAIIIVMTNFKSETCCACTRVAMDNGTTLTARETILQFN